MRVSHFIRDLNDQQSRLFLTLNAFLAAHQGDGLQPLIDDDVEEAMDALAATYETAARGVIYEHQPASRPADRLVRDMRPMLAEARHGFASSFEAGAAVVLRRIAESVRGACASCGKWNPTIAAPISTWQGPSFVSPTRPQGPAISTARRTGRTLLA
jgi:hypothetical protein